MNRILLLLNGLLVLFLHAGCQEVPIYELQGNARSSPYHGDVVNTFGVVTADFQEETELKGFFIQDTSGDGDITTSDGLFVFDDLSGLDVKTGDYVHLTGEVDEFFGQTVLKNIVSINRVDSGMTLEPTLLSLPLVATDSFERFEGMLVTLKQRLTVVDNYNLGRYGEVLLSADGLLFTPTHTTDPNDHPKDGTTSHGADNIAAIAERAEWNNRNSISLNDGSSSLYPEPLPYIDTITGTLRAGSTIDSATGPLGFLGGWFTIHPLEKPVFTYDQRPEFPFLNPVDLTVVSFNVLNYFNGDGLGGGFPTARGADTESEFLRQRQKIFSALSALDADIVGLNEIENDGDDSLSALQDLIDGLNTHIGTTTYQAVADPSGVNGNTGSDAIKVAFIYKPDKVSLLGYAMAGTASVHSRPPLAQAFRVKDTGDSLIVIVNHFKSKGCSGATGSNEDQNDGQGCYNERRKGQAGALLAFMERVKTISGIDDVLIIGDLNAYDEEDPLDTLRQYGLLCLSDGDYSYIYKGAAGSLDHVFSSSSIENHIEQVEVWHINAAEPIVVDYNEERNPVQLFMPNPYRSSDHDPIIIGLDFSISTGFYWVQPEEDALWVYPNPSNESLRINSKSAADIELFSIGGHSIFSQSIDTEVTDIDISDLSSGAYFLKYVPASGDIPRTAKVLIK